MGRTRGHPCGNPSRCGYCQSPARPRGSYRNHSSLDAFSGRRRETGRPDVACRRAPYRGKIMVHRLAPQARAELNNIWNYIARESGNLAAADGVIDAITERFYLLAEFP